MSENKKSLAAWFQENQGKYGRRPSPALAEAGPAPSFVAETAVSPAPAASPVIPEPDEANATTPEEPDENAEPPSLYEQLGGADAVNAAVDIFYRKVLADERISHFFDDVDMNKQAAKQKAFLTMAFGGPHQYTGKHMREAHAHLADRSWKNYGLIHRMQVLRKHGEPQYQIERGLKDSHFDAVLENLRNTLNELGVAEHLIAQVDAIAESTRNDVLGH